MELRLNKKIYSSAAVKECLEAYEDFGTYEVGKDGDYILIKISDPDKDFEKVLPQEIGTQMKSLQSVRTLPRYSGRTEQNRSASRAACKCSQHTEQLASTGVCLRSVQRFEGRLLPGMRGLAARVVLPEACCEQAA